MWLVMCRPGLARLLAASAWPESALAWSNPKPGRRPPTLAWPGLASAQAAAFDAVFQSRGPGRGLGLSKSQAEPKAASGRRPRPGLALAFGGSAWPGLRLEAEAGTSLHVVESQQEDRRPELVEWGLLVKVRGGGREEKRERADTKKNKARQCDETGQKMRRNKTSAQRSAQRKRKQGVQIRNQLHQEFHIQLHQEYKQ
ncbi:hypothetical protein C8J56DRAFT_1087540 [Mycena floridula]|nr:hypothetical protein C8J56DRAFT_1087540 [Mycena floridula]